jgi:hypothetical protein
MVRALRRLFLLFVSWLPWRRPAEHDEALPPQIIEPVERPVEPMPIIDAIESKVAEPAPPILPRRPAKWVKPKGLSELPLPLRSPPKAVREPKPRRARVATELLRDDPEQWGQYYFRDTILDQLDRYWIYLRRMKRGDLDSYKLLRQIGIQLMPYSATTQYDRWRDSDEAPELSAWWRDNRPGFGAVAYGFDDVAELSDKLRISDVGDPECENKDTSIFDSLGDRLTHRPTVFSKSSLKGDPKAYDKPRIFWTPRFLYFTKYSKPSPDIEHLTGGDVYKLTVYWDRCDRLAPKRWRSKRGGGIPQDYAIWIEHGSCRTKILRMKVSERVEVKWARGPHGGRSDEPLVFKQSQWMVPETYLTWAHRGRGVGCLDPQEYLRRLFVEAATMYETATLGSMVRVAVSKGVLTAVFGVEIKRTPYFFKDRDVVLNDSGTKKRIFHIVRPHVRANGDEVPMHFRGLRDFEWAGYRVSITVPGRDHFLLPEWDVGSVDYDKPGPVPRSLIGAEEVGRRLSGHIKSGFGAHSK